MPVEFHDYSVQVKTNLKNAAVSFLHEAAGEIEAQTKRNVPPGHWYAQQKNAWTNVVDSGKLEATIGNPMQEALWTEYGTGEYAINGDGRKGWWIYVPGSGSSDTNGGGYYSFEQAKRGMAIMRSQGIDAHITKGQRAKRPLFKAFESCKGAIQRIAESIFAGVGD